MQSAVMFPYPLIKLLRNTLIELYNPNENIVSGKTCCVFPCSYALNTDYLFVAVVSNVHEIFEKIACGSEASEAVNGSRSNGT